MEKNELLKSRNLKTKRINKKRFLIFQNCQKNKEKRIEQSEPSCWSKFQKGKKWTFMLSQFLEWTVMSDQICRMKKMKKTKNEKKWTFSFFSFFSFWKFIFSGPPKKFILKFCPHQKFIFFIPEKCSKQKFVFCLPPCFKISSSNTLSQTRPKP